MMAGCAPGIDHRILLGDQRLLGRDESHLKKWGRSIFANRLASLVRKALNYKGQGKEINVHSQVRK